MAPVAARVSRSVKCFICMELIKENSLGILCRCDKMYHRECARSVKICPKCGVALDAEPQHALYPWYYYRQPRQPGIKCPQCGAPLEATWRECPSCLYDLMS